MCDNELVMKVTQWGCWNTYYVSPNYEALGTKLLSSEAGGAASVLGATTLTNASCTKVLTLSGGVTGTGNLVLNNNSAMASGITLSTAVVNNTGIVTNSGTGAGTTLVSADIGASVTDVTQNSTTSALVLTGTNSYGTTTISAGIGANVTSVMLNSTTSALNVRGALTVNGVGTTLINASGTKVLTLA